MKRVFLYRAYLKVSKILAYTVIIGTLAASVIATLILLLFLI